MEDIDLSIKLPKAPKRYCYGLTIVLSESNWLVDKDCIKVCTESSTTLFPDKDERLDYAITQMKDLFTSFDFEDCSDENGKTENDLRLALEKGEDIRIQGGAEHYTFEFFETEVAQNGINDAGVHTAEAESEKIEITSSLPKKSGDITIMSLASLYEALESTDHTDPSAGYSTSKYLVYAVNNTAGVDDSALSTPPNLGSVGASWYRELNRPTKSGTHWTVGANKLFGGPLSYVDCGSDDTYVFSWYYSESGYDYSSSSEYWNDGVFDSTYVAVVRR